MRQPACFGFALAIAFNSVLLVWASPKLSIGNVKFNDNDFDTEYEQVNSKIYNIITGITEKRGWCTKHISVTGNGIGDRFKDPCTGNGVVSVTSGKILIYGNPEVDSISLFSDEPSVLIVFQEGKCSKKTYKTVTQQTFAEVSELSEAECQKLKKKISYLGEVGPQYIEELNKHYDDSSPQNPIQLNNAGRSLQQGPPAANKYEIQQSHSTPPQTSTANNLPENTLGVYSQFQKATPVEGVSYTPVAQSHQTIKHNGITVTEQVLTHGNTIAAPPAPPAQPEAVPKSVPEPHSTIEANNRHVKHEPKTETSNPHLHRIGGQLNKLKSDLLSHLASHNNKENQ